MAENGATLVGYKKTFAVVALQNDLRERLKAHARSGSSEWPDMYSPRAGGCRQVSLWKGTQ